jgi:hypothetical protein
LVLFILAVIWAAVLLPPYLQNRSESRPADSISSFQRQLSVLERRAVVVNPSLQRSVGSGRSFGSELSPAMRLSRNEARKRRRDVAMLVQTQQRTTERDTKVRYLPSRSARPEPALLLRRSGS